MFGSVAYTNSGSNSIWFTAIQVAIRHQKLHTQLGPHPELRALFGRLAHLSKIPVTPVFVFDGASRPKVKRGKQVKKMPHWLTKRFEEMVVAFGFVAHMVQYHSHPLSTFTHGLQAPGEAEAELAYLNRIGRIDAIMTEDSDVFVFGATCVLRK